MIRAHPSSLVTDALDMLTDASAYGKGGCARTSSPVFLTRSATVIPRPAHDRYRTFSQPLLTVYKRCIDFRVSFALLGIGPYGTATLIDLSTLF